MCFSSSAVFALAPIRREALRSRTDAAEALIMYLMFSVLYYNIL